MQLGSFYVEVWGCQMNVYDGGRIKDLLTAAGFAQVNSPKDADIVVLVTCAVRAKAEDKVFNQIASWRHTGDINEDTIIALGGCVGSELAEQILELDKSVNIIFGPRTIHRLPQMIGQFTATGKPVVDVTADAIDKFDYMPESGPVGPSAFVTIMEGCSNKCTYCIVPYTRGRERSRDVESILREVKDLHDRGFKEVTLLGQNVNSYGLTPAGKRIEGGCSFAELLRKVAQSVPDMRVRFTTSNPEDMTEDILHAIAEEPNLCKHIHFPAQSGSNKILKLMNRKYTREQYLERVEAIRRIIPGCGLTTDIFVGYHDETPEDHEETLSLVRECQFDSAFMFKYSERPGTYAAKHLPDNVPEEVKIERLNELIRLQTEVSAAQNRKDEGKEFDVLIESFSKRSREQLMGRTEQNKAVVMDKKGHHIGETVRVRITGSTSATLFGEIL